MPFKDLICLAFLAIVIASCVKERTFPEAKDIKVPKGFKVEIFADNLNLPTSLAFAPDSSRRLFVNELQSGRVLIFENGKRLPHPFATLRTNVKGSFPVNGENGLVGLAFDPNYYDNGYVYFSYAFRPVRRSQSVGRVVRFKDVNNRGKNIEIILDDIPTAPGHQIQSLAFGPDGKLYISVGDAYTKHEAQNINALPGKILRMNPDGSIPKDNPFPGSYTFAYGFRNCFDMAFRVNGDLVTTDNGPDSYDEMNVVQKGKNHGWPKAIGKVENDAYIHPIHAWPDIVSPAGLALYEKQNYPDEYRGKLFLVLFGYTFSKKESPIAKRIQAVELKGIGLKTTARFKDFAVYTEPGVGNPLDVTVGPDGFIYFTDIFRGKVYRIKYIGDATSF